MQCVAEGVRGHGLAARSCMRATCSDFEQACWKVKSAGGAAQVHDANLSHNAWCTLGKAGRPAIPNAPLHVQNLIDEHPLLMICLHQRFTGHSMASKHS